jgi:hypothetical protein
MKHPRLATSLPSALLLLALTACGPELEAPSEKTSRLERSLVATPVVCEDRTVTERKQELCGYEEAPYGGGLVGVFVSCTRPCTVDFRRDLASGGTECVFASYTCDAWACEKCSVD